MLDKTTQRGIWQWIQHYPSQEARALLTPQGIYSKCTDFGQIFLLFFSCLIFIFCRCLRLFPYIFFALRVRYRT
jgi:hypothetical protein